MKAISRLLRAWIVIPLVWGACAVPAAAQSLPALAAGSALVAQSGDDDLTPEDRRRRVLELIAAARQSMKAQRWDTAEAQLSRAEELGAHFGVLHFGDTPKKVRQDLERMRAKAANSQNLSQRLSPFRRGRDQQEEDNPFAGRGAAPSEATAGRPAGRAGAATMTGPQSAATEPQGAEEGVSPSADPERFAPPADAVAGAPQQPPAPPRTIVNRTDEQVFGDTTSAPAAGRATNLGEIGSAFSKAPAPSTDRQQPLADSPQQQSDRLLLAARRALARGDVRRARGLVDQAQGLGIQYTLAEDTPQKIGALIDRHLAIAELRAANGGSQSFRREQADFLMEQAEALLHWNDIDEAERLALDVTRLGVEFGPFDAQPSALLERITAVRRSGKAPALAQTAPASDAPLQPNDAARMAKARSLELVSAARAALGVGDLRQAERLARQAEALRVPDEMFTTSDDRPSLVLLEIHRARSGGGVGLAGGAAFPPAEQSVERALYDPQNDATRNELSSDEAPNFDFSAAPDNAVDEPALLMPTDNRPQQAALPPASARPLKNPRPEAVAADVEQVLGLIERGESSLAGGDRNTALVFFRQASAYRDALPPDVQQRLQQHLAQLERAGPSVPVSAFQAGSTPGPSDTGRNPEELPGQTAEVDETLVEIDAESLEAPATLPGSLLKRANAEEQLAAQQLHAQVSRRLADARRLREADDPKGSIAILKELRTTVETAGLDANSRQQYLLRVDRAITESERYLESNRAAIELKEQNAAVKSQIDREEQVRVEVDNRIAALVNEFNQLVEEQRFAEADVVARKAEELAPDNPVVNQLKWQSRLMRSANNAFALRDAKERGFVDAMNSVEQSSKPFNDMNPYEFPNIREWDKITKIRRSFPGDEPRRNERELEIIRKLRTPVSLQFDNAPLSLVLNYLAKLAEINLHLDPQGLSEEGVTTDTPVTIDLNQEISLKSALNLILEPLHLSYIIKDEVLKVTSEHFRDGNIVPKTYPVADLVIPIPNFVPGPRMGMASALAEAYNTLGYNGAPGFGGMAPLAVVASRDGAPNSAMINPAILANANIGDNRGTLAGALSGATQPIGPGGAGGGAAADFDSLIRLITTTIAPTTWDEVGGSGAISPFRGNLSLVISNTEEVHDQIRDLLQQLRRLQDLQVTIEVRFITLNDNFFERIGIDFDFDINSNIDRPFQIFGRTDPNTSTTYQNPPFLTNGGPPRDVQDRNLGRSQAVSVGLAAPGVFSTDLDIPFRQDSFTLAVPQFGGFDPAAGASFGFAILSEVEAFFFLNAAQGDRRSNVLQAPKVTLFNGQQAAVSDTSQSPFVISVIPVVGDFAAAQQPVIIILSEGTFMTVQAVVSSDRRFVRLTVVPFFSHIGDVNTFTFTGSSTTRESSESDGPEDETTARAGERTTVTEGTTVQLPTFSFVTVTTTVSVPDGGTVLLGGIKRLSEGRSEFGVPILSKVPYVNRLFKNVGIGRETQSLMMMVTPRIIIQEEEEALILGLSPAADAP